jgi:hypothetical protein
MNIRKLAPYATDKRFEEVVVKTHVLHVDSRFRRYMKDPPNGFKYYFGDEFKNVVSVKISSIEIPNTFPNVSSSRKTNEFTVCYGGTDIDISLETGNYTAQQMIDTIQTKLDNTGIGDWDISFNELNGKTSITETNGVPHKLHFDHYGAFPKREADFGLGYTLGFRTKKTESSSTHTSEASINVYGDTYLFLAINDFDLVFTRTREKEKYYALAKIIIDKTKQQIVFDNQNMITKRYVLPSPITISYITPKLLDPYGDLLDFGKENWSFTLEIETIENSHLYEAYKKQRFI